MEWLKAVPLLSHLLLVESEGMAFLDALPILQNGIVASLLVALVSAFLGVYVILKRMVFVSAALSQISSLGVAVAFLIAGWLGHHAGEVRPGLQSGPAITSLLFACAAASFLARHMRERKITRESLLGIGYALPAGLMLLILDALRAEAHAIENILFGNTVFVPSAHLLVLVLTTVVVMLIHLLLYKEFVFVALDPETAKASGLRTGLLNQLLFLTIALTISISTMSIGALPVFAFMVIPASAALLLTDHLKTAFALSIGFGASAALGGFYLSFVCSLPTGPTMLSVAAVFLLPGVARLALRRRAD
jgi:zinc transport system permease protein